MPYTYDDLDEILREHETMRRTLEIIADRAADKLQATQAKGALAKVAQRVVLVDFTTWRDE